MLHGFPQRSDGAEGAERDDNACELDIRAHRGSSWIDSCRIEIEFMQTKILPLRCIKKRASWQHRKTFYTPVATEAE